MRTRSPGGQQKLRAPPFDGVGAENVIRLRDLDERVVRLLEPSTGDLSADTQLPPSVTPARQQSYRGGTASGIQARRPSSAGVLTFSAPTDAE
jgi:hypothetical protein